MVDSDLAQVLALNQAVVSELSDLDERRLKWLVSMAALALVVETEGTVLGFAIAFAPRATYDSVNYRWFSEHFQSFLYLDRIAVLQAHRRRGIGARLYDAAEAAGAPYGRVVCEVNVQPPNPASLAFHKSRGYRELDQLEHDGGKVVTLLAKLV